MELNYSDIPDISSFKPSKEYFEGGEAYPILEICQNPYHQGTKQAEDWEHGWCDAQGYDTLPDLWDVQIANGS